MTRLSIVPYIDRINEAKERIYNWTHALPVDRPPFLFTVSGFESPFTSGEQAADMDNAVTAAIESIRFQLRNFPDTDYVPFFPLPFLGEGVIPSMFGAKQHIVDDNPPFTEGRVLASIDEVEKLPARIDPEKDGWGPKVKDSVLKFLDATHGEIGVGVTDHQSPYGIATKLLGNETLMLAMYDAPDLVHRFLDICRQATEDVITAMEQWAGDPDLIVKNYRSPVPGCGVIIWDDYISVLSPDLHRKYCLPANNTLYVKYGKGHLHTCGPYFPGHIDTVVEHDTYTVDTAITSDMKRTKEDFLELKRRCSDADIKIFGNLRINNTHIHNHSHDEVPDREFLREMLSDGRMFWTSGGTAEEGKEQSEWIASVFP
jgi:hypothetical protein